MKKVAVIVGVFFRRVTRFLSGKLFPSYHIGPSGRGEYIYREGSHKVSVSVELFKGDSQGDIQIYGSSTVRWAAPHDDELIPENKRQRLLQRLIDDIAKKDKQKETATLECVLRRFRRPCL